jgi:hypothetical protein
VHFPPHENPRINTTDPAKYGFTKDVVDLYQMLPYVNTPANTNWNHGSDGGEFIKGGEFMEDLRDNNSAQQTWYQRTIDPMYGIQHLEWTGENTKSDWNAERGPYIKQWFAVLSSCGNHGSTMVLDTKTCA